MVHWKQLFNNFVRFTPLLFTHKNKPINSCKRELIYYQKPSQGYMFPLISLQAVYDYTLSTMHKSVRVILSKLSFQRYQHVKQFVHQVNTKCAMFPYQLSGCTVTSTHSDTGPAPLQIQTHKRTHTSQSESWYPVELHSSQLLSAFVCAVKHLPRGLTFP